MGAFWCSGKQCSHVQEIRQEKCSDYERTRHLATNDHQNEHMKVFTIFGAHCEQYMCQTSVLLASRAQY